MRRLLFSVSLTVLSLPSVVSAQDPPIPEEARASFVQAMTMMKAITSPEELARPIELFREAARQAPLWPAARYNLARALELAGKFDEAIAEYRQYLELAPTAPDARATKDHIYALEAEKELAQKREKAAREVALREAQEESSKRKRLAIVEMFRGRWQVKYCSANGRDCNDKETKGRNWRVARDHPSDAPLTFAFTVHEDGSIKAGGQTCATYGYGHIHGVPTMNGEGITWEFRDREGVVPPRGVWARYGPTPSNPTWLEVSCRRPLSDWVFDPDQRYDYNLYERQ